MTTKEKGRIGEAIIIAELTKRNIQVSIPFGENCRYDLIADINGNLIKIQIKYCNQKEINGSIECPCSSSKNHTTNKHYTTYVGDVDYFAFYIVKWEVCLLVPMQIINNHKTICFRRDTPKNNQKNYHNICDYLIDNIISKF